MQNSGYIRLKKGSAVAILDVGSIGPDYILGQAHAGTLSFEHSLFGSSVIVNCGTSTYQPGTERERQRGTTAHSTVQVDGQDSSETWGSFRVARRSRARNINIQDQLDHKWIVTAGHDGYNRLQGRVIHRRTWKLTDSEFEIQDVEEGGFKVAVSRFHIHPEVSFRTAPLCSPANTESLIKQQRVCGHLTGFCLRLK